MYAASKFYHLMFKGPMRLNYNVLVFMYLLCNGSVPVCTMTRTHPLSSNALVFWFHGYFSNHTYTVWTFIPVYLELKKKGLRILDSSSIMSPSPSSQWDCISFTRRHLIPSEPICKRNGIRSKPDVALIPCVFLRDIQSAFWIRSTKSRS